jgi:hypothetical protein
VEWEGFVIFIKQIGNCQTGIKLNSSAKESGLNGSYVVKEFVSPERLAECARGVELRQEAAGRKRARREKAPIAAQLREAGKLAGERQVSAAPKRNTPDRGDR